MKIRTHPRFLGATVALIALIAVGCQSNSDASPSAAASTEVSEAAEPSTASSTAPSTAASAGESAAAGEETSVFDLEAGDCFSASGEQVDSVLVVDCEESHIYEVYHVFDHEAGESEEYPGDEEILEYADTECQVPFEEFVGIPYEDSIWYITSVTPSAETWAEGDREIVCTLATEDETEVTGSAESSEE